MAITNNPLLIGASGKMGNIVMKQFEGKTVLSRVPDMSGRELSQKQKDVNRRMQMAILSAKALTATPMQKQRACEMLQVSPNKVFRDIVKQFLLTDGYGSIFEESEQEKQDKRTLA